MTLSYTAANDLTAITIAYYMRGKAKDQTTQDKPLLQILDQYSKPFPGGGGSSKQIAVDVQGKYMSDTFALQGITGAGNTELTFNQAEDVQQATYNWAEQAYNLKITETELKQGGVNVVDDMKASAMSPGDCSIIVPMLENRVSNWMESWARLKNEMYWRDGTQAAGHTPGIMSIITDVGLGDTVGGIASGTYTWWHNRCRVGNVAYQEGAGYNVLTSPTGPKIVPSRTDQTLSRFLRSEKRQLARYGGKPTVLLCGSMFLDALEYEIEVKGQYTQDGFINKGKNDIGMADISLRGLGTFRYDPTLDGLGLAKRCYIFDPSKIYRKPMEGNSDKVRHPTRPAEFLVLLKTITDTSALVCEQRNCNGVYEVA